MASWQDILPGRSRSGWAALPSGRSYASAAEREERLDEIESRVGRGRSQLESTQREARALGIEDPEGKDDKGFLAWVLEPLDRIASTGAGFVTGLAGLDLNPESEAGKELDDTVFDDGVNLVDALKAAFERAAAGARGTHIGFGDTQALAYDDDDNWLQRAGKVVGSAAGDIVTDPLAYVSWGAGAAGRKLGTEGVESASRNLVDDALRQGDETVDRLARNAGTGTSGDMRRRVADWFGDNVTPDQLAKLTDDEVRALARDSGVLREMVGEGLTNRLAARYASGGAQGLRRTLIDDLGEEAGERAFRAMPAEARGGLRLQVPFTRIATERGIGGGGRVAEAVGLGGALRATHSLRNALQRSGANQTFQKLMGGRNGANWARALREVHAADDDLVGAGWSAFKALRDQQAAHGKYLRGLAEKRQLAATEIDRFLRNTPNAKPAQVREAMGWFMQDRRRIAGELDELPGNLASLPPEALEAGREAAEYAYGNLVDELGAEARRLFGDRAMGWISAEESTGYVPRILSSDERTLREATRTGVAKARGGSSATRSRTGAYARWGFDPETGSMRVTDWFTLDEANELAGRELFETDPIKMVAEYAEKMSRALANERLIRSLEDAGVLARTAPEWLEQGITSNSARKAVTPGLKDAQRKREALDRALGVMRQTGDREPLKEALRAARQPVRNVGGPKWVSRERGRHVLEGGIAIVNRGSKKKPMWVLEIEPESALMAGGSTDVVEALSPTFSTLADARRHAEGVLAPVREAEEQVELMARRMQAVDQLGSDMEVMEQALDVRTLPTDPVELERYLDDLSRTVGRWADANPEDVKASFFSRTKDAKAEYTRWLEGQGWVEAGVDEIRPALAKRLQELGAFGPEMVVEDMARYHRATLGEADIDRFIEGWWKPYYSTFKAFATVGRGPGFVARNVIGGSFNAWLYDVQPKHFGNATKAMLASHKARVMAADALAKEFPAGASEARIARYMDEVTLPRAFRDAFGDNATAELKTWTAFHDRGLSGSRAQVADWFTTTGRAGRDTVFDPNAPKVDDDLLALAGDRKMFNGDDLTRGQRAANSLTGGRGSGTWIRWMGKRAGDSETWLRYATFRKGVDDFGLEDGGFGAAMGVKATQFDYSDLSPFERSVLKNIVPFYTWSRHNIPLQFRALMTEPGKINRLLHVNDALREQYGDEDGDYPIPDWVEERFGWASRLNPGDVPVIGGLLGEDTAPIALSIESPAMDLNKWLEAPKGLNPAQMVDFGEVTSGINPIVKLAAELAFNRNSFTGAPLNRTDTPEDERVGHVLRSLLPPVGQVERVAGVGERYADRRGTSIATNFGGIPAMTLTEGQQAGELYGRNRRLQDRLDALPWERRQTARKMLDAGMEPEQIAYQLGG